MSIIPNTDWDQTEPSMRKILEVVSRVYGVSKEAMAEKSHLHDVSEARQVYFFMCYEQTSYGMRIIGESLNVSTTTVSLAIHHIASRTNKIPELAKRLNQIREAL